MDESFWAEVERAKQLTGPQKLSESFRLFDEASERMLAGIKAQFPHLTDEEARRLRRERIDRIRRLEALP
ncbi:MAG: hypothetical protein K8T25_04255 [Planctomycetia bacterium]|nr:hypothetical protein [Planctomycetia bacterium]